MLRGGPAVRARAHDEAGVATLAVVMVLMLVATLTTAIVESSIRSSRDADSFGGRSSDVAAAEGALELLQQSLAAKRPGQNDEFKLTSHDLAAIASESGGTVVSNGRTAYPDTMMTGASAIAIQGVADGDGLVPYWQIVNLIPAQPERGIYNTIAFVRAWRQDGGNRTSATPARVVRAELRPGSFADYQVIADGPINFEATTTITGHIHSNGFLDDSLVPPARDESLRIWRSGTTYCGTSYGITPVVSTAKGKIDIPLRSAGCTIQPDTGNYINLARSRESMVRMKANCGARVRCFLDAGMPRPGVYTVVLSSSIARIYSPNGSSSSISMGPGETTALLFNRDVRVQGSTRGRVTIAAFSNDELGNPAPTVTITGNITRGTGNGNSVGILSEGDVAIGAAPCVTRVQAALVAGTGAIGIPRSLRVPTVPSTSPPKCTSTLQIQGSLASHLPTTMLWRWGNVNWSGYSSRSYQWDPSLRVSPPPFFPLTNSWELVDRKVANGDCFNGPAAGSATCR